MGDGRQATRAIRSTFLVTDIADPDGTWRAEADEVAAAVARHHELLDEITVASGGVRPEGCGEGEPTVARFASAADAVDAAITAQRAFHVEAWPTRVPLQVRMGIDSTVDGAAGLRELAHGGQIMLSAAACEELDEPAELRDLGEHRLEEPRRTERVFQVLHPELPSEFPPLRSSGGLPTPRPAWGSPPARACVRLLGAVRFVSDDGTTIDLASASQRRLLAVLAIAHGATLRAEYLSDLLGVSLGGLRTTVSRLRSRLGEEVISTDTVGYRITCAVDSAMFTDLLLERLDAPDHLVALEEGLGLWDGEALDEFRHEAWAQAEVSRLDELHCVAVEDRAELLIRRGRAGEAVASLEAQVGANPLRDRSRGLLIEALASDGRQADALRAYQDYRAFLAEETGTLPSALVQSIERRVAAGWGGVPDDPEATTDATAAGIDVPLPGVLAQGAALIGRRRELTWLQSELVQARSGSLRTVLVSGEAGIGKTTLVGAFARDAAGAAGTTVLYGRCDDQAAVPMQPFRSIVASLVDRAPLEVLRAHCEHVGGELQRIAPQLSSRIWSPPPITADDATERHQLFEAIADLMCRCTATGPLVLILDDLHWAEPTALLLLRHLARALVAMPALVVASFRDTGEASDDLRLALADLDRGSVRRVSLAGFDDAELSDLVESFIDARGGADADVLAQLREQTAGNPLYAAQLVRHLSEAGHLLADADGIRLSDTADTTTVPPSLLDVVWSRVRALGDVTHEVLRAGSVLGTEFDEETLVEMTDATELETVASVDASVEAGILVDTGEAARMLRFTHRLVAQALYSELRGSRRRRMHERAARVLQKSADVLPQATIVQLARHWAVAGDVAAAQRWATAAGDHAYEHLAPSEAATWYETALVHAIAQGRPESERADLMVRLGSAQRRAGDPDARRVLVAAAGMARHSGSGDVLIRAALANDMHFMRAGAVDEEQLAIVESAIDVADPADVTTRARLLAIWAQELIHGPDVERRHQVARQAIELIDASDDRTLLPNAISGLTYALWGPGALPLRRDLANRAVEASVRTDDPSLRFWATRAAYLVAIEAADPVQARASYDRLQAIASDLGEPRLRWIAEVYKAFVAMMEARLDDAERHAEVMLEIGTEIGESEAFAIYAGQMFVMRSFAGRYEELLPLLEEVMATNPGLLPYRLAYGIACTACGREDEARAILHEAAAGGFAGIDVDYLWITTTIGYAVLTIELQDVGTAAQLYPMIEPFGEEVAYNGVTSQGPISAYLGKLASLLGRHDVADAHLRQALGTATAFGWRYHEATTLVALALSRRRRCGALDGEADAWLDRAAAIGVDRTLPNIARMVASVRD